MIAPIFVGLLASVFLYVVFAGLFGSAAGVLAILVLGAVGFIAWLSTLILSAR